MHDEIVLMNKVLHGVAHNKRRQDEQRREGFSLSSAPFDPQNQPFDLKSPKMRHFDPNSGFFI
jgi:hypothetical protein